VDYHDVDWVQTGGISFRRLRLLEKGETVAASAEPPSDAYAAFKRTVSAAMTPIDEDGATARIPFPLLAPRGIPPLVRREIFIHQRGPTLMDGHGTRVPLSILGQDFTRSTDGLSFMLTQQDMASVLTGAPAVVKETMHRLSSTVLSQGVAAIIWHGPIEKAEGGVFTNVRISWEQANSWVNLVGPANRVDDLLQLADSVR
jgi:hypothetical protein